MNKRTNSVLTLAALAVGVICGHGAVWARPKSQPAATAKPSEPKGCSQIANVYAYSSVSNVDFANALVRLDLTKGELEKSDEYEKRKKDAWARVSVASYAIGDRKFYGFFAPLKRTGFHYDVETEHFSYKPGIMDSLLGGTDPNMFGDGHVAESRIIYEPELKPIGTYEGSNAFGASKTVYVADLQQYALDLPKLFSIADMSKPRPSFDAPMPRAKLGGPLDDIGILIFGDLRTHGYAKITDRQEPTLEIPLDKRITKHVFFVTPVCAYFYNIKTQTVLGEIPHIGQGWGSF